LILSIDTTSEVGSIALTEANFVVEEAVLHAPEGFGYVLFGHIERLLEKRLFALGLVICIHSFDSPFYFTMRRFGSFWAKNLSESFL